jgi:hypothetical protein
MQAISRKKQVFPINADLRRYLARYRRETRLPVVYNDLVRFNNTLPLLDREGRDTHWETTF